MSSINRRALLAAAAASVAVLPAVRASAAEPREIALWPGLAPGGEAMKLVELVDPRGTVTGVMRPTLTLHRPEGKITDAVLIIPGGGFRAVMPVHEGSEIAAWLAKNGIASGILVYRLPAEGWPPVATIQDAQRAMRILKKELGAARNGALGFSAGGAVAAALDARAGEVLYPAIDDLDRIAAKPDFVGLGYTAQPARLAADPKSSGYAKKPAPTFIFHAADDVRVPVAGSRLADAELKRAGGQTALHIFPTGGHGFALRSPEGAPAAAWPKLFVDWLKALPPA